MPTQAVVAPAGEGQISIPDSPSAEQTPPAYPGSPPSYPGPPLSEGGAPSGDGGFLNRVFSRARKYFSRDSRRRSNNGATDAGSEAPQINNQNIQTNNQNIRRNNQNVRRNTINILTNYDRTFEPVTEAPIAEAPITEAPESESDKTETVYDKLVESFRSGVKLALCDIIPWLLGFYLCVYSFWYFGMSGGFMCIFMVILANGVFKWWLKQTAEELLLVSMPYRLYQIIL